MNDTKWYDIETPIPRPGLRIISNSYDTDKKPHVHNYISLYSEYFDSMRYSARAVLEIGVLRGESLRMWKEYFPSAHIFGIDIDPSCLLNEEDRIGIFIGEQGDSEFLLLSAEKMGNDLDIIIDDGSHIASDYKISFDNLFPLVKSGGWYVIEDINNDVSEESSDFISYIIDGALLGRRSSCGNREIVIGLMPDLSEVLSKSQMLIESVHIHNNIFFIRRA